MSGQLGEIKKKIRELNGNQMTLPISCEIVKVDGISCTVKIAGGLEVPDVRLRASLVASDNSLVLTPKVGSKAMIWSVTGTLDDTILLKSDEYETLSYKQNGLEVLIDSKTKKVTIKNERVSLKSLMEELHDVISNLKVITPNGPSTALDPSSIASLLQFKTHISQLLND
jgi:hypothetical protein